MMKNLNHISVLELIGFSAFAGVGGMLAYLLRTVKRKEKPIIIRAIIEALASAFVGIITMLVCKAMDLDWQWSGVVVGVFGWLGAESSIVVFSKLIRERLGLPNDSKDKEIQEDKPQG